MSSHVARGLCVGDVPGGPMGLAEVLDAVVAHGCDGVQLPSSDGPTEQQRGETGLRAPAFAFAPR